MVVQRAAEDRGQATVELVALVPVIAALALVLGGFLAAHAAREAADQAAIAGAVAALQGSDPVAAGRSASPAWARVRVRERDGAVRVTLAPRLPAPIAGIVDAKADVVIDPGATP